MGFFVALCAALRPLGIGARANECNGRPACGAATRVRWSKGTEDTGGGGGEPMAMKPGDLCPKTKQSHQWLMKCSTEKQKAREDRWPRDSLRGTLGCETRRDTPERDNPGEIPWRTQDTCLY